MNATAYGASAFSIRSSTEPSSVNLNALESRLRSTCWRRCSSVTSACGASSATSTENVRPRSSATERNARST